MNRYFINNGKMAVHITEWGLKESPVIFCLHGLGSTSLTFLEIAESLQDPFRIIAVDMPGHGKTPPFENPEDYGMPQLAEWVNDLLNRLEVDQFYSLSHSWGSLAALYYLSQYPERVTGTILIDGGYQAKKYSNQSLEEEIAYYHEDFEQNVASWDEFVHLVKKDFPRETPALTTYATDLFTLKNGRYYWHARGTTAEPIIRAMHKDETEAIYEKLPPGIVLLRATLPESTNAYRNRTAALFKEKARATVKSIPGTTHLLHWDKPEVVLDEIRSNWQD